MCGILLALQQVANPIDDIENVWRELKVTIASRGPDAVQDYNLSLVEEGANLNLRVFASELRLRGIAPVVQPHVRNGDVFCWNGEVFEGLDLDDSDNDGRRLFERIQQLDEPDLLPDLLGTIEGPYAFVYYHNALRRLYFARDPLGRRSLLVHWPSTHSPRLLLTSVSIGPNDAYRLEELSTRNIFAVDLRNWNDACAVPRASVRLLPRSDTHRGRFAVPPTINEVVDPEQARTTSLDHIPDHFSDAVEGLMAQLDQSVRRRVYNIPRRGQGQARVAVLFSGGIDSTMLAYLADRHLPPDEPIDLLNVAFENPRKIQLKAECDLDDDGVRKQKKKRKPVAIPEQEYSYLVPDRMTGIEEVRELRSLCPRRTWNFVEVNVTYEESTKARPIVEALMHPSRTVMDMSLGLALYFASSGVGQLATESRSHGKPYRSTALVLLNGVGADELLGGYGRHRTTFNAGGWLALIQELQQEIDRIPERNLGRDDRIVSSHGKEARHPFLSLSVVNYLAGLPVHLKTDLRLPLGMGDKILLRLAARKVGLILASERKKRAMQFGSHSARLEAGGGERYGDTQI